MLLSCVKEPIVYVMPNHIKHFFFFLISKISLKKEKGTKSMYTKYVHQICQNYKDKENVSMKSRKEKERNYLVFSATLQFTLCVCHLKL